MCVQFFIFHSNAKQFISLNPVKAVSTMLYNTNSKY